MTLLKNTVHRVPVFSAIINFITPMASTIFTAIKFVELLVGGSFRYYDMKTNGTLIDDKDKKITIKEYGAFVQAVKTFIK